MRSDKERDNAELRGILGLDSETAAAIDAAIGEEAESIIRRPAKPAAEPATIGDKTEPIIKRPVKPAALELKRFADMAAEGKISPVGTQTPPEIINPLLTPLWSVDARILNPNVQIDAVPVWGTMGERRALPRQGVITFSAKRKQGKSTAIYALLTALIKCEKFDTFTPEERPRLVMAFDTEMDDATLATRLKGIHAQLGEYAPALCVVPLLNVPKSERRQLVNEMTDRYNPDIIVIDQAARMVQDFNNNVECSDLGEWIMQMAAKRTAIVVIHQNKAKDDEQMKGHLGTIFGELAVENYAVKKDKGIYTVTAVDARSSNTDDAAPFRFALDADGRIIDPAAIIQGAKDERAKELFAQFRGYFGDNKTMTRKDLKTAIMRQEELKDRAADNLVIEAVDLGVIKKTGDGHRDPYCLDNPDNPRYADADMFNGIRVADTPDPDDDDDLI